MTPTAVAAVVVFAVAVLSPWKIDRIAAVLGGAECWPDRCDHRRHRLSRARMASTGTSSSCSSAMVIVSVTKQTGVFDAWISRQLTCGRPFAVMVTLVWCGRRFGAARQRHHGAPDRAGHAAGVRPAAPSPRPACRRALASNIGGTATLIGDPPHHHRGRAGLDFNAFWHLGPIVVVLLAVFVGLAWLMWGRMMVADAKAAGT
jgi:Na+/H+ antiporter NhaD/arsenite permease-like protein